MPQIQAPELYNAQNVATNKIFRERLMDRFKSSDWVRVINIDDEDFTWLFMPASAEDITYDNGSMPMKNTFREPPQVWRLAAGESEVITGENAYLMIEGLYKKVVAKGVVRRTPDQESHVARNFNWTDPQTQEEYIDKIYLGKESPQFNVPAPEPTPTLTAKKS
jgi:hypothetical protein